MSGRLQADGLAAALAVAGGLLSVTVPLRAMEEVPLQCRLEKGAWQPCRMGVEDVGRRWWLQLDSRRWQFQHDGSGRVRMQAPDAGWRSVEPRWESITAVEPASHALCWDGVCALGPIPLD
ncbi:hypothetical protein EVJ50_04620 [Synechococcus sp. RSCCF101]|uniref:hypothetical protein n=1 Tax=Synechococcus sp. RSCCF101 TaxID=2511069 RepID=UPI001245BFFB|nr:hypothetical protein [Synechococcus sp. RSCCF101]QEY31642.1 hypothetical protein EVJ50_04620 [Synechococcus sp. RSCCF101]